MILCFILVGKKANFSDFLVDENMLDILSAIGYRKFTWSSVLRNDYLLL